MTNFERWQRLMKDVCSPQTYVDFGFYYLIAAALQRRVWVGPSHFPLYPNLYVILVGEPGLGKGVTIKPVADMIKHHKLKKPSSDADVGAMANYIVGANPKDEKKDDLLFPVIAEAITYEALVQLVAASTRFINYKKFDEKIQKETTAIYSHASACFCLEELSSLFRKHADDAVNFLLCAWDCGDYDYITKNSGKDRIRRCCLSLLAGTTTNFMQKTFSSALIGEGFTARTIFIYETSNRSQSLSRPELTPEQQEDADIIRRHVFMLSKLYGPATYTPEAWEFLEHWWKNDHTTKRVNRSPKMLPYYAKKNMQVQKIAMAMHFGETTDSMVIGLETVQRALAVLDHVERKMHLALTFNARNPLAPISRNILAFLVQNCTASFDELFLEFSDDVNTLELNECLSYLVMQDKIKQNGKQYAPTMKAIMAEKEETI